MGKLKDQKEGSGEIKLKNSLGAAFNLFKLVIIPTTNILKAFLYFLVLLNDRNSRKLKQKSIRTCNTMNALHCKPAKERIAILI